MTEGLCEWRFMETSGLANSLGIGHFLLDGGMESLTEGLVEGEYQKIFMRDNKDVVHYVVVEREGERNFIVEDGAYHFEGDKKIYDKLNAVRRPIYEDIR